MMVGLHARACQRCQHGVVDPNLRRPISDAVGAVVDAHAEAKPDLADHGVKGLSAHGPAHLQGALQRGADAQGHVDGRGTFISAIESGGFWTVKIGFPAEMARYFFYKGSVAIEGISLTIAKLYAGDVEIDVIPK